MAEESGTRMGRVERLIKTEERFRETDQRFRETGGRIDKLVSAIGDRLRLRNGGNH